MTSIKNTKMHKGILLACILFTFLSGIVYIGAFELPDNSPIITLISSTQDTDMVAVLTSVSVDTLTNAGVKFIEIYEDGTLLERKDCNSATCTFVKTIVKTQAESHTYFAKTQDLGGNIAQSSSITVNFKGTEYAQNQPPTILSTSINIVIPDDDSAYTWKYNTGAAEKYDFITTRNRTLDFKTEVSDPENGPLTYNWFVNSESKSSQDKFNYTFENAGDYNITLILIDNHGKIAAKTWDVKAELETVYGQVVDTDTGLPLANINISFYPGSTYNVETGAGNYSALQPKTVPDTRTNRYGYFRHFIDPNEIGNMIHMLLQGSNEKDFEIYIQKDNPKQHDAALSENQTIEDNANSKNFNAEGHILHSGRYEHANNYTCGEDVEFTMFGINHGSENETITFLVEDHTSGGESHGVIKYNGSISNPAESLIIQPGETVNKVFTFRIPCTYAAGRYDIHVIWEGEKWHKIGNFFTIQDTTSPTIELIDCAFNWKEACPVFAKQNATIGYRIQDPWQDGTIPHIMKIQVYEPEYINLELTANNGAGQTLNFTTINGSLQMGDMNLTYNNSGHYTVTGYVKDSSGNTGSASINISIYLPENEANTTAVDKIYHWSQIFMYNVNCSTDPYGIPCTPLTEHILWDRVDAGPFGDEYATNGELNRSVVRYLDNEFYTLSQSSWLKGLFPVTYDEFNYTLSAFYTNFQCYQFTPNPLPLAANCSCGAQPVAGNESCYRNFVPQIWNYGPLTNPTAQQNLSSYNFGISAADPNKKDQSIFTIKWYVDNNLVKSTLGNESGASGYSFDLNTTPGIYTIKAVALDYSGENVTIYSKHTDDKDFIVYTNTRTWTLNVTA